MKLTNIRNGPGNVVLNEFSPDAGQSGEVAIAGLFRGVNGVGDFHWTGQGFASNGQSDLTDPCEIGIIKIESINSELLTRTGLNPTITVGRRDESAVSRV